MNTQENIIKLLADVREVYSTLTPAYFKTKATKAASEKEVTLFEKNSEKTYLKITGASSFTILFK